MLRVFRSRALAALAAMLAVALGGVYIGLAGTSPATASPNSAPTGWIRFAHFSTTAGVVSLSLDRSVIDATAGFGAVTPYVQVTAGPHTLALTPAGASAAALTVTETVPAGGAVTVAAFADPPGQRVELFTDDMSVPPAGDGKVRIINTLQADPSISVSFTPVGTTPKTSASANTLAHVAYANASSYAALPSGTYNVAVNDGATAPIVVGNNWPLSAGSVSTLAVIQSQGTTASVEILHDAVGVTAAPVGPMQTGFGGAAGLLAATGSGRAWTAGDTIVVVAVIAIVAGLSRRRRATRRDREGRTVEPAGSGGLEAPGGVIVPLHRVPLPPRSERRSRPVVRTVGLVGLALASVLAGMTLSQSQPAGGPVVVAQGVDTPPVVVAAAAPSHDIDLSRAVTAPARPTTPPSEVAIPSIGVQSSVTSLGLNSDGSAQVPATTSVVGWYDQGPAPGQPGPAVLLGHVDSKAGPAVFFKLRTLTQGTRVVVTEGASTVTFEVQSVQEFSKADFPTSAVFGPTPDRALRLVTCGGQFDRATGHYADNVVVFATEVSSTV